MYKYNIINMFHTVWISNIWKMLGCLYILVFRAIHFKWVQLSLLIEISDSRSTQCIEIQFSFGTCRIAGSFSLKWERFYMLVTWWNECLSRFRQHASREKLQCYSKFRIMNNWWFNYPYAYNCNLSIQP